MRFYYGHIYIDHLYLPLLTFKTKTLVTKDKQGNKVDMKGWNCSLDTQIEIPVKTLYGVQLVSFALYTVCQTNDKTEHNQISSPLLSLSSASIINLFRCSVNLILEDPQTKTDDQMW